MGKKTKETAETVARKTKQTVDGTGEKASRLLKDAPQVSKAPAKRRPKRLKTDDRSRLKYADA